VKKKHTIVVSDLHLADAEPIHEARLLWKKFRQDQYFIDDSFQGFLKYLQTHINDKGQDQCLELVLNGDIFDFDSIIKTPEKAGYKITPWEKKFGLDSTQEKSLYKMQQIINDHAKWFLALSKFLLEGNSIVFVIGNHDIELYWPMVQKLIVEAILGGIGGIQQNAVLETFRPQIRFCEFFYISNGDTLIEHGHQYDPYCMAVSPIHPIIKSRGQFKIRLPFGNLANRYMVNQMGLKNPHSDESFVKSAKEFVIFFFRYEFRTQPFMIFTWLIGAIKTLYTSLGEGFRPSVKDPLSYDDRIKKLADRSNAPVGVVLALRENHEHPAVLRPFKILRELWLDRALFLLFIVWACWQIFTTTALFASVSLWWFSIPLFIALPFFFYYAHGVQSDVRRYAGRSIQRAPMSALLAGVRRIVHGHTHHEAHLSIHEIEYLNCGTWSPRFLDVECTKPKGEQNFVWIKADDGERKARLMIWRHQTNEVVEVEGPVAWSEWHAHKFHGGIKKIATASIFGDDEDDEPPQPGEGLGHGKQ